MLGGREGGREGGARDGGGMDRGRGLIKMIECTILSQHKRQLRPSSKRQAYECIGRGSINQERKARMLTTVGANISFGGRTDLIYLFFLISEMHSLIISVTVRVVVLYDGNQSFILAEV